MQRGVKKRVVETVSLEWATIKEEKKKGGGIEWSFGPLLPNEEMPTARPHTVLSPDKYIALYPSPLCREDGFINHLE